MNMSIQIDNTISRISDKKYRRMEEGLQRHTCNRIPVLTSLPYFNSEFDKKKYTYHLKISIASELDFSNTKKLSEEFMLQHKIEKKIMAYFQKSCEIKKVFSYHQDQQNIHHWYISNSKIKLSINNIIEFDGINKERAINFEIKKDENWNEVGLILDKIKDTSMSPFNASDDMYDI